MRIFFVISSFLFLSSFLYADTVVIYSTDTNNALSYRTSVDPFPYLSRTDALIFNDRTTQTEEQVRVLVSTTPIRYFKKTGNPEITEMTPAEKAQVESDRRARRLLFTRISSSANLTALEAQYMLIRALSEVSRSEINILRGWDSDLKVAVAAATTLAQLKTNIAALPTLADRTLIELRNAILNTISSGGAD